MRGERISWRVRREIAPGSWLGLMVSNRWKAAVRTELYAHYSNILNWLQ